MIMLSSIHNVKCTLGINIFYFYTPPPLTKKRFIFLVRTSLRNCYIFLAIVVKKNGILHKRMLR